MKFIPRLFSTPMVQAILDNRKSKTRRTDGLELVNESPNKFKLIGDSYELDISHKAIKYDDRIYYLFNEKNSNHSDYVVRCPYKKGDILWVRETWRDMQHGFDYKADYPDRINFKWKPSLFMPKSACRIFLKVKSVKVERLQDISEEDAKAEGVKYVIDPYIGYCGLDYIHGGYNLMTTPYKGFRSLWKKINGEQSWNDNPWVWVIDFERIEKPENFIDQQ